MSGLLLTPRKDLPWAEWEFSQLDFGSILIIVILCMSEILCSCLENVSEDVLLTPLWKSENMFCFQFGTEYERENLKHCNFMGSGI